MPNPRAFTYLSGLVLLLCGLSIILGVSVDVGALAIAVLLLVMASRCTTTGLPATPPTKDRSGRTSRWPAPPSTCSPRSQTMAISALCCATTSCNCGANSSHLLSQNRRIDAVGRVDTSVA
ncbi:MAG: DoxX family protein [Actinomycetota bacterium]